MRACLFACAHTFDVRRGSRAHWNCKSNVHRQTTTARHAVVVALFRRRRCGPGRVRSPRARLCPWRRESPSATAHARARAHVRDARYAMPFGARAHEVWRRTRYIFAHRVGNGYNVRRKSSVTSARSGRGKRDNFTQQTDEHALQNGAKIAHFSHHPGGCRRRRRRRESYHSVIIYDEREQSYDFFVAAAA